MAVCFDVPKKDPLTEDEAFGSSGLSKAGKDSRLRLLFEHLDVLGSGRVNFQDLVARLQGCIRNPSETGIRRNLCWSSDTPTAAAVKVLLALDTAHIRILGYLEFVLFMCCFMHAGDVNLGNFLGSLLSSFDSQFSTIQDDQDSLYLPCDGRATAERRVDGIFHALSNGGSKAVHLPKLALLLQSFEPAKEASKADWEASSMKLTEYHSRRGSPLDRASFAEVVTEFAEILKASVHELVDYICAIFIASAPSLTGACVSDVFARAGKPHRLPSVTTMKESLRSFYIDDLDVDELDIENLCSPTEAQAALKPKCCPPHGAKQTTGVRPEMEDSYITIPNFLHVNMHAEQQEKWPTRLAVDSNPNSPCPDASMPAASDVSKEDDVASSSGSGSGSSKMELNEQQLFSDTFHFFGVFDGHGGAEAAIHCTKRLHTHLVHALKSKHPSDSPEADASDRGSSRKPPSRSRSRLEVLEVPENVLVTAAGDGELEPDEKGGRAGLSSEANGPASCETAAGSELPTQPSTSLAGHYMEGVTTMEDLEKALTAAFLRTDEEFCATDGAEYVGSTAVCTLIGSRFLCIANCGDSRAVISRGNGQVVALTDDHKPDREDEKSRVEAAGGQILYWNGRRVMGVLAMSRAIGDQCLQPYVIPDPEITIVQRRDDDELIVMGSDGLWDVLSNEETVHLAKKALKRAREKGANSRAATKVAATVLIRAALSKGSRDNITAIVVDLTSTHDSDDGSGSAPGEGGVAASRGAIARGASADHRTVFKAFSSEDSANTGSPSTPGALLSDEEHTEPSAPVFGNYESIELRK